MATTIVEEFVSKINKLTDADRAELVRRLNQSEPANGDSKKPRSSGKKRPLHPNTVWIKENKHKYPGSYVALKDGKLIAVGRTIKEADLASRAKGVNDPLLRYILAEGEEAWGGW